jgi:hypothetical protein
VAEDEEADLIEPYKGGLYEKWGVRKQLLDDLYIRFFRLAEKRIAEVGGRGIVSFISNYSWLEGLSHPVMRERLAANFDEAWIDNCNGDKYKTGKRTPAGTPDESMFTTDEHRIGIQVGTAITTLVKRGLRQRDRDGGPTVIEIHYRDLWGTGNEKRSLLLKSLARRVQEVPKYEKFTPRPAFRWGFASAGQNHSSGYEEWPHLAQLFPVHYSGLNENRLSAFIAIDRQDIAKRMRLYYDPRLSLEQLAEDIPGVDAKAAGYDAAGTRKAALSNSQFEPGRVVPLSYRPFDDWWTYWEGRFKLFNRPRPDFFTQVWPGNMFLSASQTARKGGFNSPIVVDKFGDLHLQDPWSQFFPLFVRVSGELQGDRDEPNVDHEILEALCQDRGTTPFDEDHHWTRQAMQVAESVFWHALAIFWSPAYRSENEAALRHDWPRVPIPADPAALDASADLGRAVGDLLLPDRPVPGVTSGRLRREIRALGVPSKVGGGPIDPSTDLKVEAGWGFRGQKNAVMCGKGKVIPSRADPGGAVDLFINDRVSWSNVPADVWALTIGGYPVLKKWLSYREFKVLGRPLREEEMTYFTEVVRRLKALLLLGPALDANYRTAAAGTINL